MYIDVDAVDAASLSTLTANGVEIELASVEQSRVQGWVQYDRIDSLVALTVVRRIKAPAYASQSTGSTNTAGDAILRANLVRSTLGVNGTGVKVGVISDGANNRASAQATGDLPGSIAVFGTCSPSSFRTCNEGTAMLEIIHDLAPGATLGMGTVTTSMDFVQRVTNFVNWGADIIVDDLGYFAEPYFEDGPPANAYVNAIAQGVVVVSAAGNDSERHYQGSFSDSDGDGWHNFAVGDELMAFTVNAGSTAAAFLQWPNRFGSASDDYDLYAYDVFGNEVDYSVNWQNGSGSDPFEQVSVSCPGPADCTFSIAVKRYQAAALPLELFVTNARATQFLTPGDAVIGHKAVQGVISVAAISASDPGSDTIEPYSSRGPSTIYFPSFQQRATPTLTAIDCVSVTGVGGFGSHFCGTSAAAPHAAAVAALMISAKPSLTRAEVVSRLQGTAADRGVSGFDNTFGSGLIDALAAVGSVTAPPLMHLDNDASGDAFVYQPSSGQWVRLFTAPGGGFAQSAGGWGAGWSILPATFDGDALSDFFLSNATTGEWSKMLNTGDWLQRAGDGFVVAGLAEVRDGSRRRRDVRPVPI